jgi:serine/threonine-protein kinase
MSIENEIEKISRVIGVLNPTEYGTLYNSFNDQKLVSILATFHSNLVQLFESMNTRLPVTENSNPHFWANESRELKNNIRLIGRLRRSCAQTKHSFEIDEYYNQLFEKCSDFLVESGGSTMPVGFEEIDIYYTKPIFLLNDSVSLKSNQSTTIVNLQIIGEGSYAKVFKYVDPQYQKHFVLKRAKSDLNSKELSRFKREFEEMKKLNSPYVVEVYKYLEETNEYIMEFMDRTLDEHLKVTNSSLSIEKRKSICYQFLKGLGYLHSKGLMHRDLSPKNVLVKVFDNMEVFKISDFGLVKTEESELTSLNTEFKGYFNDPHLRLEGFSNYSFEHEMYAATMISLFILTGKTNMDKIKDKKLVQIRNIGLNPDKSMRFKSVENLTEHIRNL